MRDDTTTPAARSADPFRASLLARPALLRVLAVAAGLVPLWLAVAWAMSVP